VIAAIYARKSTDQNIADEEKSVTRQVERARAYAARKGWTVDDAHVYSDDGISGAEFERRPGYFRLLNALKPRPPFQVLIMSEVSRLGREASETAYAIKQLLQAGVRLWLYLEDRELVVESATDKLLMNVVAFADEMEREKARQRTYDVMARKARDLHVTGGRVYGYDNVEVLDAQGRRQHVVRRLNEEQAAVVRRIFALCAEGMGFTRIAKALNEDEVAPPRRASGWAPTAVREILLRSLYRGEVVWNRTRKRDQWGVKRSLDRPEHEWLIQDQPELRIVPEELWRGAHTRLERARSVYAQSGSRAPLERPGEKYLLSGIAKCGTCGGSLAAFTRASGGERGRYYGCMYHHKRGGKVCTNGLVIRQDKLDQVLLDAIAEALDERLLERAVEMALLKARRARHGTTERPAEAKAQLAQTERAIRNLQAAIEKLGADAPEEFVAGVRTHTARRRELLSELELLAPGKVVAWDERKVRRQLEEQVADVRRLLEGNVAQTRQILRKLLVGRLECTPFEHGDTRGYRFTGDGSYEALLPTLVVAPTGFEPVF
jgi:site-specific DNA recombinase